MAQDALLAGRIDLHLQGGRDVWALRTPGAQATGCGCVAERSAAGADLALLALGLVHAHLGAGQASSDLELLHAGSAPITMDA